MTQPNIRRLRQKVGTPGATERRSCVGRRVWASVKNIGEKFAGLLRIDWDDFGECLTDPDFYGIIVGALCFVSIPGEPLVARLLLTAVGFFAGWGLAVMLFLFTRWVRGSYQKHPAPWVLLGVVTVLYWLT